MSVTFYFDPFETRPVCLKFLYSLRISLTVSWCHLSYLCFYQHRQSKLFFDLEARVCEELGLIASRAATDSETVIVEAGKHVQLCETYSSSDEVIAALIANKNIGKCQLTLCFLL